MPWLRTSLSTYVASRRAASFAYCGSSAMSPAAVWMESWSSSRVVAPSKRPLMVFVATRSVSTCGRPVQHRFTARTILFTSTASDAPLRLVIRIVDCGRASSRLAALEAWDVCDGATPLPVSVVSLSMMSSRVVGSGAGPLVSEPSPPRATGRRDGGRTDAAQDAVLAPARTYPPPSRLPGRDWPRMSPAPRCWQVFGLTSVPAFRRLPTVHRFPVLNGGPVRCVEFEFSITAAGQPRSCAGFPFQPSAEASGTSTNHNLW